MNIGDDIIVRTKFAGSDKDGNYYVNSGIKNITGSDITVLVDKSFVDLRCICSPDGIYYDCPKHGWAHNFTQFKVDKDVTVKHEGPLSETN